MDNNITNTIDSNISLGKAYAMASNHYANHPLQIVRYTWFPSILHALLLTATILFSIHAVSTRAVAIPLDSEHGQIERIVQTLCTLEPEQYLTIIWGCILSIVSGSILSLYHISRTKAETNRTIRLNERIHNALPQILKQVIISTLTLSVSVPIFFKCLKLYISGEHLYTIIFLIALILLILLIQCVSMVWMLCDGITISHNVIHRFRKSVSSYIIYTLINIPLQLILFAIMYIPIAVFAMAYFVDQNSIFFGDISGLSPHFTYIISVITFILTIFYNWVRILLNTPKYFLFNIK